MGMSSIIGMLILGKVRDGRELDVPLSCTRRYSANIVPAEANVLRAIPVKVRSELSTRLKYPRSALGLPKSVCVVYGAGDQPCQSIGNGAIHENALICNIGSGGQIAAFLQDFRYDENLRTQTYCHAVTSAYTILGATLNAGMSLNWFANKVLQEGAYTKLGDAAASIPA